MNDQERLAWPRDNVKHGAWWAWAGRDFMLTDLGWLPERYDQLVTERESAQ